jgi:ActR/RegA family two-component response regulator
MAKSSKTAINSIKCNKCGHQLQYPSDVEKVLAAIREQHELYMREHTQLEWDAVVVKLEKCVDAYILANKHRNMNKSIKP